MEKNKKKTRNIQKNIKNTNKKNNNISGKKKVVKTKKKIVKETLIEDKNYKLAESLFKNSEYLKAYKEYLKLSEVYPKDKKIYKRLIESLTHNYTYKENSKDFKMALDDYITTYRILGSKKEVKLFENKLLEYKKVKVTNSKSRFLLITFLGVFGVHKFLEKKYIKGLIYLLTLGLFGIGVIVDLINDYALYEDDRQLNILRYLISLLVLIFGLLRLDTSNYYYFVIIAILMSPFVYSKLLRLIPSIIKIVIILVLCYFGFKTEVVIDYVPTNIKGVWITENENTNFLSIDIKQEKSTVKFNDRKEEIGLNEYDSVNKILKIYVNATNIYKFRINDENSEICTYNDAKKCIISFKKQGEVK